jgi:hypothetical protein
MLDKSWPMDRQFVRDRGQSSPYNMQEAYFVAKDPLGNIIECTADLDYSPDSAAADQALREDFNPVTLDDFLHGRPVRQRVPAGRLQGVQFLCPRCGSPVYVPTLDHPNPKTTPRRVTVHWEKLVKAEFDQLERPIFTIEGEPLVCDYLLSEIRGFSEGPMDLNRCGWRGIVEWGKAYEHSRPLGGSCRGSGDLHVRD